MHHENVTYKATGASLRALRKRVGAPLSRVAALGGWASTSGVSTVENSIVCEAATVDRYLGALRKFHAAAGKALSAFDGGDVAAALEAAAEARATRAAARVTP